jgi:HAMP domain-containing protein
MKFKVTLAVILMVLLVANLRSWNNLQGEADQLAALKRQFAGARSEVDPHPDSPIANQERPLPGVREGSGSSGKVALADVADAAVEQIAKELHEGYPELARDLRVTESEATTFLQLLARQRLQTEELIRRLARDGTSQADASRMLHDKILADEAQQAELLGDKYRPWKERQNFALARPQVAQLQTLLAAQGNELTQGQIDQLTAAMAPEIGLVNKEFRERMDAIPRDQLSPSRAMALSWQQKNETNRRVIAVAAAYLSPSQLDQFSKMLNRAGGNPGSGPGARP